MSNWLTFDILMTNFKLCDIQHLNVDCHMTNVKLTSVLSQPPGNMTNYQQITGVIVTP